MTCGGRPLEGPCCSRIVTAAHGKMRPPLVPSGGAHGIVQRPQVSSVLLNSAEGLHFLGVAVRKPLRMCIFCCGLRG